MATNTSERGGAREQGRSSSSSSSGTSGRGRSTAMTTDTILDIVERLGLIDLVTSRVRARLEEVDIDELFDELGDYVRRNPEVLVVALATITVSAGLIVYLNSRRFEDRDERDDEVTPRVAASRATAPRSRPRS